MKKYLLLPLLLLCTMLSVKVYADVDASTKDSNEETNLTTTEEISDTPVVTEDESKNSVKSINKYFELELIKGSQNPLTRGVTYTLRITPKIDSSETEISWDVPTTMNVKTRHKEFVSLEKDKTYTYNATIYPLREGTYDITANVTSWQHNINYTNSVSSTIIFNKNLITTPIGAGYILGIVGIIVGCIAIFVALFFVFKKYGDVLVKRLKYWLTPPF